MGLMDLNFEKELKRKKKGTKAIDRITKKKKTKIKKTIQKTSIKVKTASKKLGKKILLSKIRIR